MIYLDASAILPMVVVEAASAAAAEFGALHRGNLMISDFAAGEVASGLSRLIRTDRMSAGDADGAWERFDLWRLGETTEVFVESADLGRATAFVRRHELSLRLPDAIHAAICRRLGYTLATLDTRLAAAARALGVAVIVPTDAVT